MSTLGQRKARRALRGFMEDFDVAADSALAELDACARRDIRLLWMWLALLVLLLIGGAALVLWRVEVL